MCLRKNAVLGPLGGLILKTHPAPSPLGEELKYVDSILWKEAINISSGEARKGAYWTKCMLHYLPC